MVFFCGLITVQDLTKLSQNNLFYPEKLSDTNYVELGFF